MLKKNTNDQLPSPLLAAADIRTSGDDALVKGPAIY